MGRHHKFGTAVSVLTPVPSDQSGDPIVLLFFVHHFRNTCCGGSDLAVAIGSELISPDGDTSPALWGDLN
jgi:hypothetical protein